MIQGSLSKRYAQALLDLSGEAGGVDALRKSLASFSELLTAHPSLKEALGNEMLPISERRQVLQAVYKSAQIGTIVEKFLLLLVGKKRFNIFDDIVRQFSELADEKSGLVHAHITSATTLNDAAKKQLQSELARLTGKQVDLEMNVDPKLLGGVITRIGHTVYDGSVTTQIELMKERMLKKEIAL